jgi:tRNA U34 5-carboxymethylaminomethyl modifying GTPase MnmE/TrmE
VIDVAGIEAAGESEDSISRQMRERAMGMIESADHVVLVRECGDEREELGLSRGVSLVVDSKLDLESFAPSSGTPGEGGGEGLWGPVRQSSQNESSLNPHPNPLPEYRARGQEGVRVSARTWEGMNELRRRLDELAFGKSSGATLAINGRHIRAIEGAREAVGRAMNNVDGGAEVLAVELREGLDLVGEIVGQVTPDDVLGRIFAGFCIGK